MENLQRKNYFWNSVAGIVNAAEAVVMSMMVTRFGSLSDAGVLSLAFAIGNVLMTVGKFGGRIYQVTDTKKQYKFRMYVIQRLFSLGLMLLSLAGLLILGDFSAEKSFAILFIGFIYVVESFEDCVWGQFQLYDRLYVGAQMFVFRWLVILLVFFFGMICFHNMTTALLYAAVAGGTVFAVWVFVLKQSKKNVGLLCVCRDSADRLCGWFPALFKQTVPLFISSFCSIFISNIPKFAINHYLSDDVQACYGFVAMPVFVIGLLNQFVYQPAIVRLTNEYIDGSISRFKCEVRKQIYIVSGISVLCILGAGLLGVPILSFIYHTDLHNYFKELLILQVAGGFLALSGYFTVILTIMRKQMIILSGYILALTVSIPLLLTSVSLAGTKGASVGFLAVMIVLFVFYYIAYRRIIRKGRIDSVSSV